MSLDGIEDNMDLNILHPLCYHQDTKVGHLHLEEGQGEEICSLIFHNGLQLFLVV